MQKRPNKFFASNIYYKLYAICSVISKYTNQDFKYSRTSGSDRLSALATSFPKYQKFLSRSLYLEPLVSDQVSSATSFPKYQKFLSRFLYLEPLVSDQVSSATSLPKYQKFLSKFLYLEPLVNNHLSRATVITFRAKSLKFSYT